MIDVKRFRVYPFTDRSGLFARVLVFPTKKAMYSRRRVAGDYEACFVGSVERYKVSDKIIPVFGELHFSLAGLRAGIIAHEFLHAALEWARRKNIDLDCVATDDIRRYAPSENPEEQICWAHGNMIDQFYGRAARLGLEIQP